MEKIKNIFVPTDFSVTARNAFHYAQGLAEVLEASLTVVHVKDFFIPVSDVTVAPFDDTEDTQLTEALQAFISEENTADGETLTQTKVRTLVLRGNPVTRLLELSEEKDTDLMVLGTTGLQDLITQITGSTSLKVANKAHCPVIIVPRLAEWRPIDRVMYASNYDSMTPQMIGEATDFARMVHAATHFVHVSDAGFEEGGVEGESQIAEINWAKLFSLTDANLSYQTHSIYGGNTTTELNNYAEIHDIDLMVFVSKHRSFWENLMHKSVTQQMAGTTTKPMIVMHVDDAPEQ